MTVPRACRACARIACRLPESRSDEEQSYQDKDGDEHRQAVFADVVEEMWSVDSRVVADGFDHEIRAIADVSEGSEAN